MNTASMIECRLRSHLLSAPPSNITDTASHMLATQGQDFWGARWALAVRTEGDPSVREVDGAFDRGEIVRSWTMRGTIHVVPARDLGWVLAVTGERQFRSAAGVHRREGLDADEWTKAERLALDALSGGNRLTRAELAAVLQQGGVDTAGQRGYHLLVGLSLRALVCQGPVVPREGGPTREQYVVRTDEWIMDAAHPTDPLAELFARYIASHGPAGARDFAWWSGLPLGLARTAAAAASERQRVEVSERPCLIAGNGEQLYVSVSTAPPHAASAQEVIALPPFDEYYLSYADRTVPCAPEFLDRVGPSKNGIVRPILLSRGEIVGVWTHSVAVGRHTNSPVPELFVPNTATPAATDAAIGAALDRYRTFITA